MVAGAVESMKVIARDGEFFGLGVLFLNPSFANEDEVRLIKRLLKFVLERQKVPVQAA